MHVMFPMVAWGPAAARVVPPRMGADHTSDVREHVPSLRPGFWLRDAHRLYPACVCCTE